MWRVPALLALLLAFPAPADSLAAIRSDWASSEVACAETLDIKLGTQPKPESESFVPHVTWLSDVVLIGEVTEIRHDITGEYPTTAVVNVGLVRKGEDIPQTIEIVQNVGPHYSHDHGFMIEILSEGEPRFQKGDVAVLFLTRGLFTPVLGGGTVRTLQPNQFALVMGGKWSIVNGIAEYALDEKVSYPMATMTSQIDTTWSRQRSNCE